MNTKLDTKEIRFKEDASSRILNGIDKVVDAVQSTLGPKGNCVIIENGAFPLITKDGITVARSITLSDPFENLGASMIKQASWKTLQEVGDGTTTVTVLARAIFKEGIKKIAAGYNPVAMKRGIDKAVSDACNYIKSVAIPVKGNRDIENVARISSNGDDEIAKVIAEAMDKVGTDGIINVAESKSMDTYLTTVDGMQFNRGYLSPYFINNQQSGECILEDCQILMTDKAIKTWTEIMPALQLAMNSGKPLLIMADGIEPEVLRVLILNVIKNNLSVCAIAAPGYAEIRRSNLEDIAILTNGKVIAEELGTSLDKITTDCFGRAQKVIIGRDTTTIIGGAGDKDAVEEQVNKIRLQISQLTTNDDVAIDRYKKRIARLTSGVAIINVGGNSDAEVREKMDRIDDALRSTKAATEEGIVPGGSTVYINSLHELNCMLTTNNDTTLHNDDEIAGYQIIINAIKYPLKAICENAGKSGDTVINKVFDQSDPNYGYNAARGEYCDMISCGIIEPAKISRVALQNAASAAGMLLTSRCAIVNDRVDPEKTITLDGDALMGR